MIVQCPYCATRYEVDATRLAGANPMLKCSRCRHIFPAPSSKKQPLPPPSPAAKHTPAADDSLTLPFDEGTWKDEELPADDLSMDAPEEGFTLGTEEPADELEIPDAAPEPDSTPTRPRLGSFAEDEDEVEEQQDDDQEPPRRKRRPRQPERRPTNGDERGKVWAILTFLALVTAGYAVLTRALFASPALCDRVIGRLPLVGTLGDDRLLTRKVALSEVVGSYQRIKDGKDVFVIVGKALNTAPVALHGVQLLGKLFDMTGKALDQKTIYCGNVISAKVLKDLTPQEVSILQKLSPPKRFMIEPGESSTFVIVFMDPPRDAVEFSTQVVAAQRQA